jgi:plasmid stabilization system protein ParE
MPYTIRRSPQARKDIRDFFRYLRAEAGEAIALKYFEALEHDLLHLIANSPHAFSLFHETGAPYRAKLFKLARTTYWIVYTVDDEGETVDLLRFWNSAREPGTHGL